MDWKKKLKFVCITAAFAILIMIVLSNVFNATRVSENDFKMYSQGLLYLEDKDFENAYFNFASVSKNSAIYEISLLRQALCADELNDSKTAVKKYRMFIEKYPESMFVQKAYYALAQNYYKEKEYSKAEKTLFDLRKDFKNTEYTKASNYYLGLITKEKLNDVDVFSDTENKKEKAKDYFVEYLSQSPNGRFSMDCIKEINLLQTKLTQNDYYIIARAYFKNGFYQSALNNLLLAKPQDAWVYLSLTYTKLGQYSKAREVFDSYYQINSDIPEEDELLQVIENYAVKLHNNERIGWGKALVLAEHGQSLGADYILYRLTKYENGDDKLALYRNIYSNYSDGKYASDAVANLFWNAYVNNDLQEAKMLGHIHIRDYENTKASPKVLYWLAKLSEKEGSREQAKAFYRKLIQKYPDTYYAYRASKHLGIAKQNDWATKISNRLPEKDSTIEFPYKQANITSDNVALVDIILKLNDYKLLAEADRENKAIQSWINYKEHNYATSALFARDCIDALENKPDFSQSIYKLAYPMHYQDLINKYSKFYNLDSYLVISLIREESYFNREAKSAAGAIGLMQLMPSTASYIAANQGLTYKGVSSLVIPSVNIHLGNAYLKYAKDSLYDNDMLAVASYNGGPNAVKNWKHSLNYKNFDEFIEAIPYSETRDYVKKVYRSYWVYLNVY